MFYSISVSSSTLWASACCSHLNGVDLERLLEAAHALLELLVLEVQQGFGAHGPGAAAARQLPGPVIVLVVLQDVSQEAVKTGRLLLLQLPTDNLLRLQRIRKEEKLEMFREKRISVFRHTKQTETSRDGPSWRPEGSDLTPS